MSDYMNAREYQAIMSEKGYKESQAVKLALRLASKYKRQEVLLKHAAEAEPANPVYAVMSEKSSSERASYVWQAINIAEAEHNQGWQYFENGDDFVAGLMVKYEGDLTQCDEFEKKTIEFINYLDQLKKQVSEQLRPVKTKGK